MLLRVLRRLSIQSLQIRRSLADLHSAHDSNTFGTLGQVRQVAPVSAYQNDLEDEDEYDRYMDKIADTMRPRPFDYLRQMEAVLHSKNKDVKAAGVPDLKGALNLLEEDMKDNAVKPLPNHYRVLIHACGRMGHMQKAFLLYRQYCDRKFDHNFGIFADLFNACANTPASHTQEALAKATHLRCKLSRMHPVLPRVVYHNMIKAFGRCGRIDVAFDIVDEMTMHSHLVDSETICHLLQSCISDKKAGFRHAVGVWRRMRARRIKPNLFAYNLMLRAAKECQAGPKELFCDLLIEGLPSSKEVQVFKKKLLAASMNNLPVLASSQQPNVQDLPNFLDLRPNMDHIFGIERLETSVERLQLLGGVNGIIDVAVRVDGLALNIKTFSLMLNCIENRIEAEQDLLEQIKRLAVKTDVDFFNQLMRRQIRRRDNARARATFRMLTEEFDHRPNIMTFGILSLACSDMCGCKRLLRDLHRSGLTPNVEILTTLLTKAIRTLCLEDVMYMLDQFHRCRVKPDARTLSIVEDFFQAYRTSVLMVEKGQADQVHPKIVAQVQSGCETWNNFLHHYHAWLKQTSVDVPQHPWTQFLSNRDLEQAKEGRGPFKQIV